MKGANRIGVEAIVQGKGRACLECFCGVMSHQTGRPFRAALAAFGKISPAASECKMFSKDAAPCERGSGKGHEIVGLSRQSDTNVQTIIYVAGNVLAARYDEIQHDAVDAPINAMACGNVAASNVSEGRSTGKDRSDVARDTDVPVSLGGRSAQATRDLDLFSEKIKALEKASELVGGGVDNDVHLVTCEVHAAGSRSSVSEFLSSGVKGADLGPLKNTSRSCELTVRTSCPATVVKTRTR